MLTDCSLSAVTNRRRIRAVLGTPKAETGGIPSHAAEPVPLARP
jgi:hypothetical protein